MNKFYNDKRVLLADDSPTIRKIISGELQGFGFVESNIKEFANGKLALDFLKMQKVDLIVSDWNMPDMTGLELLHAVRADKNLSKIPFLMVTSEAEDHKKKEAFESGADQYVTKPFEASILERIIFQLLTLTVVFKGKKVLVLDDSPVMRTIVGKNLRLAGFHADNIMEAGSGEEAFAILLKQPVDLIMTDWYMPNMTGLEFTKKVRGDDKLKKIPILMVSSETHKEKIIEAIKEGISDYIIKPFNAVALQDKVKKVFAS